MSICSGKRRETEEQRETGYSAHMITLCMEIRHANEAQNLILALVGAECLLILLPAPSNCPPPHPPGPINFNTPLSSLSLSLYALSPSAHIDRLYPNSSVRVNETRVPDKAIEHGLGNSDAEHARRRAAGWRQHTRRIPLLPPAFRV